MRYLIDIGHPAHVHYFKNLAFKLTSQGHEVLFTCRDKDVTIELLKHYKFRFVSFGKPYRSVPGKFFGMFYFTFRIILISVSFRPDMLLNATMYAAVASRVLGKPHLSLEDTFNMEQVKLYLPFTSYILTGDYAHPAMGRKEIQYSGYQELMYLHPDYFKPDKTVLHELGIKENEPYVILRFVSWTASHDIRHKGIREANKILAVSEFSKYARVFISSEQELPDTLIKYRINIEPHRMHDALAFACLVFGESATMVTEGAMLGVPGIYLDNTSRYYTRDLETRYELVFNFSETEDDQIKAIEKGIELLRSDSVRREWRFKQSKMLSEKINVTEFFVWFIEEWPESIRIMKENPEYHSRFL
ncbi:MAG: DUF354 domain-containing protein [Bacteroidales bacterium]|nr:DUF354 domain-containing protein [Bacteroidales bacterium]